MIATATVLLQNSKNATYDFTSVSGYQGAICVMSRVKFVDRGGQSGDISNDIQISYSNGIATITNTCSTSGSYSRVYGVEVTLELIG